MSDETLTKSDLKALLGETEQRLKQYVDDKVTASEERIVGAVNGAVAKLESTQSQQGGVLADHTERLANIQQIQQSEIKERDRQDDRLSTLEAKAA